MEGRRTGIYVVVDANGDARQVHEYTSGEGLAEAATYLLGKTQVKRSGPVEFVTPEGVRLRVTVHTPIRDGRMVLGPPPEPCVPRRLEL